MKFSLRILSKSLSSLFKVSPIRHSRTANQEFRYSVENSKVSRSGSDTLQASPRRSDFPKNFRVMEEPLLLLDPRSMGISDNACLSRIKLPCQPTCPMFAPTSRAPSEKNQREMLVSSSSKVLSPRSVETARLIRNETVSSRSYALNVPFLSFPQGFPAFAGLCPIDLFLARFSTAESQPRALIVRSDRPRLANASYSAGIIRRRGGG